MAESAALTLEGSTGLRITENIQSNEWPAYSLYQNYRVGAFRTTVAQHDVFLLKFKTPKFESTKISEKAVVKLLLRHTYVIERENDEPMPGPDYTQKLRYALCISDSNRDAYKSTVGTVSDVNQIKTGEWDVLLTYKEGKFAEYSLEISTPKIKADTTYFLILWPREIQEASADVRMACEFPESYMHICDSSMRIDIGSEVVKGVCYIDNGNNWKPAFPHVDSGESWDICG